MRTSRCAIAMLVALAGCTIRAPFTYPDAATPAAAPGPLVGALHAVCDRRADRSIGAVYEGAVDAAVTAALRREMLASGAFARIESLPACAASPPAEALRARGIDVLVQPSLDQLRWEVPDYDQIVATSTAVGLLGGAVGGVAYGMTDTDVFGRTEMRVTIVDARHGTSLDRTYRGEAKETTDKMFSDSDDMRRTMAARSFAAAMRLFRADMAALAP